MVWEMTEMGFMYNHFKISIMEETIKRYTVVIHSENQIGLLTQVANIFTRHSLNMSSLAAGASPVEGIHTITIVTDATPKKILEVVRQLEKKVDVVRVLYYSDKDIIYRELALYKVPTDKIMHSGNIEELLQSHNAKIIELNKDFTVISKVGTTDQTQKLYDHLNQFGVIQFQRSGRIVVSRERQEPLQEYLLEREKSKNNKL
ncbi:MAG: acetolactate synthase small subunit [Candidatus Cryptobacteroides sp.]